MYKILLVLLLMIIGVEVYVLYGQVSRSLLPRDYAAQKTVDHSSIGEVAGEATIRVSSQEAAVMPN